ncbi:putative cytokinin 7-beta-glucosyltransferase [Helianthus anomalus]
MADNGRRRWRLVLVASPLQGHMTPMLQLGTYLHSKGFSITIAHPEFNPPDSSNHPDFIFLQLPDNLSGPGNFTSFLRFLQALNDNCKPHLQEYLVRIINAKIEEYEKESVVIIYDNLMVFGGSVAVDLDLPSIIMHTSGAAFFPAYKIIPQLHQEGRFPVHGNFYLPKIIYKRSKIRPDQRLAYTD